MAHYKSCKAYIAGETGEKKKVKQHKIYVEPSG